MIRVFEAHDQWNNCLFQFHKLWDHGTCKHEITNVTTTAEKLSLDLVIVVVAAAKIQRTVNGPQIRHSFLTRSSLTANRHLISSMAVSDTIRSGEATSQCLSWLMKRPHSAVLTLYSFSKASTATDLYVVQWCVAADENAFGDTWQFCAANFRSFLSVAVQISLKCDAVILSICWRL